MSLPFEAIATRLQTSDDGNFFTAVKNLWANSKYGIDGFYKSMYAYIFLNWQSAIVNTIFTTLKSYVVNGRQKNVLSTFESFLLGAIARCLGLTFMFPIIRVKTLLMAANKKAKQPSPAAAQAGDSEPAPVAEKPLGIIALLTQLYNSPNALRTLYRGLGPELLRGVMSTAIVLSAKEQLYAYNYRFLVALTGSK